MLNGFPILVVEDELTIANMLVKAIKDLEGCAVGPVATVVEGMALLETEQIAAAILDAHLQDRDVTPLALALIARSVPFVVCTASSVPEELAALHPNLPLVRKPAVPTAVLAALLQEVSPDRALFRR